MSKRKDKKFKPVLTKATIDYLEQFEMGEVAENFEAIQKTKLPTKRGGSKKISEFREVIPTLEGLGLYIGRSVSLIKSYCKENVKFKEAVERIKLTQAKKLITFGLTGKFNNSIVKLLLVKHGYIVKEELVNIPIKPEVSKKQQKELDKILKDNSEEDKE